MPTYRYKPVLLKAVLLFAHDKGLVKLSGIVTYFREFYEVRWAAGGGEGQQYLHQGQPYRRPGSTEYPVQPLQAV